MIYDTLLSHSLNLPRTPAFLQPFILAKKAEGCSIRTFEWYQECLGWQNYHVQDLAECQKVVELFLERYHYHRPHMVLGMTPPSQKKEDDWRISAES